VLKKGRGRRTTGEEHAPPAPGDNPRLANASLEQHSSRAHAKDEHDKKQYDEYRDRILATAMPVEPKIPAMTETKKKTIPQVSIDFSPAFPYADSARGPSPRPPLPPPVATHR
jgi:hypothetical protein